MDKSALNEKIERIDREVLSRLPRLSGETADTAEMMRYSLEGGGKRVRPLLTLLFCEAAGGDAERALPFGAAVEFIHTYSLIHDDLPCMDNDDVRRGKPASHIRFGEANALLAGDALLTHAFSILAAAAQEGYVSDAAAVKAVRELSVLAGAAGMVGGQYIDLKYEGQEPDPEILFQMDALKTGALIEAACVLGLLAAEAGNKEIAAAREYARNLGLAFQIMDDVLEYEDLSDHSDEKNGKATYVRCLGLQRARALAAEFTEKAVSALAIFGDDGREIEALSRMLLERKS